MILAALLIVAGPHEDEFIQVVPVQTAPAVRLPPPPSPAPPPLPRYSVPPKPATSPGSWVTNDDYPAAALRGGVEGAVGFRLEIDEAGVVRNCGIIASSGSPLLDNATCDLMMRRARFTPARDRRGRPIVSSYQNRIRWVLPPEPVVQLASWAQVMRITIGADGAVASCASQDFGVPAEAAACLEVGTRLSEDAPSYLRGSGGEPVTITMVMMHALEGAPMPGGFHEPAARTTIGRGSIAYDVSADGRVQNCRVVLAAPNAEDSGSDCDDTYRYQPGSAPAGLTAPYHVTLTSMILTTGEAVATPPSPSDGTTR